MELLEKYIAEIEADLKIDEFNIKETSLKVAGKKHFWVSRLIRHKRNLNVLEAEKDTLRKTIMEGIRDRSPVKLSGSVMYKSADDNDLMSAVNVKIADEKLIIEFLEKCEKVFSSLTYDVKNIIEIMKLEQL